MTRPKVSPGFYDAAMATTDTPDAATGAARGLGVELNGLNTIAESERRGRPRDLFWPWFAANVSVFGISYGAFLLGFGISFAQAVTVGLIGIVVSFLLVGVVSLAGKRGSAPTMVLSRAAFGVNGNRLPSALSWLLTLGWETVLASLAVLATATVLTELGLAAVSALPAGSAPAVIGGLVFMMTGFGLGWVNAAADYSRYLPRTAGSGAVVSWTTLGGALAPVLLVIFGLLLAGSSAELSEGIADDPIGALTTVLPIWFLIPFALVAVLGLVGGAVLDIYSSGLALLSAGLRVPRYVAAGIDGVLMILGAVYVVFFAADFLGPFQGFLITLGVPIAAWCGIFVAEVALRRRRYAEADLYDPRGRYGSVRWTAVALVVVGTFLGWGLVTNTYAPWLAWQGYLLGPVGGKEGAWAFANLGVLVSLLVGFLGTLVLSRSAIRAQESVPE